MSQLHLLSPRGFAAGAVYAGIRSKQTPDLSILLADRPANAAAVFTTNKVFAAPIAVGREHVAGGRLRGIVVNSGNANACTGKQGLADAREMCRLTADAIGCAPAEILPSSTGIIGHLLPMEKLRRGIPKLAAAVGTSAEHALAFADAILTTDLVRKTAAVSFKVARQPVTIAGVCKGSGMIGPRMAIAAPPLRATRPLHATMLAYLTTDADITPAQLRKCLAAASDSSFNAVTVDDHTSPNDTAAILASGASGVKINTRAAVARFSAALAEVCQSLAYQIAKDGEGATKVVKIVVSGAASDSDAAAIARAIANSPLVKCAMHGNDPNWGRIVSAAGMCGAAFDADHATLTLAGTRVFHKGRPLSFDAAAVSSKLGGDEVVAHLNCNLGRSTATVWTCDLSREYITINADYHT